MRYGDRRAAGVIEGKKFFGERFEAPPLPPPVKNFGVLANPFDVVHGAIQRLSQSYGPCPAGFACLFSIIVTDKIDSS